MGFLPQFHAYKDAKRLKAENIALQCGAEIDR
jgi:hypothetical protein